MKGFEVVCNVFYTVMLAIPGLDLIWDAQPNRHSDQDNIIGQIRLEYYESLVHSALIGMPYVGVVLGVALAAHYQTQHIKK